MTTTKKINYIASAAVDKVYKYSKTYFAKVVIIEDGKIRSIISDSTFKSKEDAIKHANLMIGELILK